MRVELKKFPGGFHLHGIRIIRHDRVVFQEVIHDHGAGDLVLQDLDPLRDPVLQFGLGDLWRRGSRYGDFKRDCRWLSDHGRRNDRYRWNRNLDDATGRGDERSGVLWVVDQPAVDDIRGPGRAVAEVISVVFAAGDRTQDAGMAERGGEHHGNYRGDLVLTVGVRAGVVNNDAGGRGQDGVGIATGRPNAGQVGGLDSLQFHLESVRVLAGVVQYVEVRRSAEQRHLRLQPGRGSEQGKQHRATS